MGPIELLDEVGQDVAWAVTMRMYEAIGERMTPPAAFFAARELHLEGKKTGKGFYLYDANGKRTGFNPLFTDTLGLSLSPEKVSKADAEKYAQRLILTMVDEAARCLEEKVVQKPREVDLAMVLGIGFPPFRGGLLRYADSLGIEKVIDILEDVYAKSTPKRTVSNYLLRLKNEGRRFFSRG
jgi:3-hydroxyacyl-CoA dehydrogenase/enoyl-CoA hydratase/3-hydroxybutyryl-CoA epimerase